MFFLEYNAFLHLKRNPAYQGLIAGSTRSDYSLIHQALADSTYLSAGDGHRSQVHRVGPFLLEWIYGIAPDRPGVPADKVQAIELTAEEREKVEELFRELVASGSKQQPRRR